eukprot:Plantae.Rhodophyta-Palmaria_palmata.ctg9638.p1 GENE.Plantae.Rhodophyta-Palmaria_palmata.ctg9638~~Plantae.Rhodophyta-Palmaria_palmata.ctg9638.p1  ORF type:complete len:252 (-),score=28.56 Plantae.Rhodophyta-Palmaria_palmata.ctg9638:233-955(-)
MDEILSGDHPFRGDSGTSYMEKILTQPAVEQTVVGSRMLLEEIPMDLHKAVEMCKYLPGREDRYNVENRWILVAKRVGGVMRFYVSAAFERDIVSWETINETYRENKKALKDLYLPDMQEKLKWTQGWIHQLSLHNVQGIAPCATKTPPSKIILATGEVVDVECLACLKIVNLEEGYIWNEYMQPPTCEEVVEPSSRLPTTDGVMMTADNMLFSESLWDTLDEFRWTDDLEELRKLLTGS